MKRSIRANLAIKIAAVCLFVVSTAGAALGFLGMAALGEGYGIADTYYEDTLCTDPLVSGMYTALWYTTEGNESYYSNQLITRYQGLAVRIYGGEPGNGVLVGTWGEMPETVGTTHTMTVEYDISGSDTGRGFTTSAPELRESVSGETGEPPVDESGSVAEIGILPEEAYTPAGYYTVEGYLPCEQTFGSIFYLTAQIYGILHPLSGGNIVMLAVGLLALGLLLLVFLLCSAGHRPGCEGITPNWQDRIPFDLYLCGAGGVFTCAVALGVLFMDSYYNSAVYIYFQLTVFALCILAAELVALAALMTMATRLKLGKWWSNTLCFRLFRWSWRLCRRCAGGVKSFYRILPMTWRTVLFVIGVLAVQTFLTLAMFESYNGGFFYLVALVVDAALIVGAAWLVRQLQMLQETAAALARGDLEVKTDAARMYFDCRTHAEHLNAIGVGMSRAVEQRLKSERLKTELITNVSHDIKTPLTSIVNYVDLLKKEELPETAAEYVAVLDRQSNRLKKLTEDLVEASKASTGNIPVKLEPIVVNEIIHQAIGDYNEKLTAGRLEVIVSTFEGNQMVMADGRLLWRVLDNLLNNVCKYAMPGTRVYVSLEHTADRVLLSVKNISRDPLNGKGEELMERFVRGDASRHTEGSGLGLNIAQSLMELMGGTFRIGVDGDLFKAELTLKTA